MSVKELIIYDAPLYFKFTKADNIEGAIRITTYFGENCPRANAVIDRGQIHLLYLYLQEHLGYKANSDLPNLGNIPKELWLCGGCGNYHAKGFVCTMLK